MRLSFVVRVVESSGDVVMLNFEIFKDERENDGRCGW